VTVGTITRTRRCGRTVCHQSLSWPPLIVSRCGVDDTIDVTEPFPSGLRYGTVTREKRGFVKGLPAASGRTFEQ
jgi:hypothetical protein